MRDLHAKLQSVTIYILLSQIAWKIEKNINKV